MKRIDALSQRASRSRGRLVGAFWVAAAASVALHQVPHGRYALYPFALLSTWAHEMGHGLTALLLGGGFTELRLYASLGGTAYHTGGGGLAGPLISAGGLLGPALAGAVVIVAGARSERTARAVLVALGAALALSVALWIRTLFGASAIALLAVAVLGVAFKSPPFVGLVLTQLLGIQFCLGSLSSTDYMFTRTFERGGQVLNSDTQNIAEQLLLPYWFWGGLIAALSVAILGAAFWLAWLSEDERPEPWG